MSLIKLRPSESMTGTSLSASESLVAVAERSGRSTLRAQIAKLEGELADTILSGASPTRAGRRAAARLLTLGELECRRDALLNTLREAQRGLVRRGERESAARAALELMVAQPARYRHVRIANADLGQGGCGVWSVQPRLGLVGMFAGWWQVKLSSGCPLPSATSAS